MTARPRNGGARGKADLHIHTLYSDGTASVAQVLDWVEHQTDLDLIAITDHERIDGALRARELHAAGDFHFELSVGEEITTRRGHLLALFIEERIPALRPLGETVTLGSPPAWVNTVLVVRTALVAVACATSGAAVTATAVTASRDR